MRHTTQPDPTPESHDLLSRPRRADARRNYDALLGAARDAFAEVGTSAALEDIARRANVGIGTLYRHFPTRRDLFEGVYVNEVESLCQAAADLTDLAPWEALVGWLHRFVEYAATKRAIVEELAKDSTLFRGCRAEIVDAGEPLLRRAQDAGAARADITFDDVLRLFSGITMMPFAELEQRDRLIGMAIDGVRAR
ncbi:MAG: transcriptional regulator TetR family [Ilumatobacteraceae bacterium]|nr:transcriptional regulator TetR family [Ilumatobacteraceae bacterium]